MTSATDLLAALQAADLPVIGFTIRDEADVDTWTFYGPLTAEQAARAVAVVQAQQRPASPPASTFWPAPTTTLERNVRTL